MGSISSKLKNEKKGLVKTINLILKSFFSNLPLNQDSDFFLNSSIPETS